MRASSAPAAPSWRAAIFGIERAEGRRDQRSTARQPRIASPRDAIEQGIYLVPEDRKRSGLILDFPIRENITLASLEAHARRGMVDSAPRTRGAPKQRERLRHPYAQRLAAAGSLSGGNQQKVVLAKWLSMAPQVLIFDEPTRGVDVGAKNEIYRLMRELADHGVGILMISSDMEEVIGVSDRVAVMHEGRIAGFLERSDSANSRSCRSPSEGSRIEVALLDRPNRKWRPMINRKDLWLFVLILVVGTVVAIINPRFLSPINLSNTANLIGLFGIFAVAQAFVIISGGIELSVGSIIALLGVLFVDLVAGGNSSPASPSSSWWRSAAPSASCTASSSPASGSSLSS